MTGNVGWPLWDIPWDVGSPSVGVIPGNRRPLRHRGGLRHVSELSNTRGRFIIDRSFHL